MNDTPTVFVVDDDAGVRQGLSRLLQSAGFAVAPLACAQEFLDAGYDRHAGCVLLDIAMPGLTGVEFQRILVERGSALSVVFLSGQGDIDIAVHAMKAGACDFLTKPVDDEVLIQAVRIGIETNRIVRTAHAARDRVHGLLATLTPREREVLQLVVAGKMNKQIAGTLGTAEKTVKVHRARAMVKLKVRTLADLVHLTDSVGLGVAAPVQAESVAAHALLAGAEWRGKLMQAQEAKTRQAVEAASRVPQVW